MIGLGVGLFTTSVRKRAAGIVVPPNAAPVWTSSSAVSVNENTATAFYTCSATDAEADALTYSIQGGADAAKFAITGAAVRFVTAPNFEVPSSAAASNVYDLVLGLSDGINGVVPRAVAVTVVNVLEVALAGVTVTPVSGLSGAQAAGTVLANITGRVAGDDLALTGALAAGAVFNGAKTQIVVGVSGLAAGSYAYSVTQSHPDAAATAVTSGTATIAVPVPVVTPISFAYTDTSATDVFSVTTGSIAATQSPTSYGLTGGTGTTTLTKVGTYGTLVVTVASGAYTYTPNNAAMNAVESGSPTDVFAVTATNGTGTGTANLTVTVNGVAEVTVSISGQLANAIIGQAYDSALTVLPGGTAVTLDSTTVAAIAAHSIVHNGFGRFTSGSVT